MKQIRFLIISMFVVTSCGSDLSDEKILEAIAITSEPEKKIYNINDEFDVTGMVVTAMYSDNSTESVAVTPAMLSYDFTTPGTEKTVIVTYQGKTASVTDITVNEAAVTAPGITSFSPAQARHSTTVTITGTNFSTTPADNIVTFNNIPVVVESATENELKVTVPKNMECSGLIRVTLHGNTGVSSSTFTYMQTYTVTTIPTSTQIYAHGLAVDASDNMYVADMNNRTIRKITPAGVMSTVAGNGETSYFADGPAESATFPGAYGVALDKTSGTIYVSCVKRIRKIADGVVTTLAGDGTEGLEDGAGNVARFWGPAGLTLDASGNLIVPDYGGHRIRKVTSSGVVTTIAGSTHGFADGTGTAAQFNFPHSAVADAAGNLFVTDRENSCIRKITPTGVVTTFAGGGSRGSFDATGTDAQFWYPNGITIDAAGNLYVSDYDRIRKITPSAVVTTVAGGTRGYADGTGTNAQFALPTFLAMDNAGNLYVSDSDNGRIRKIVIE